MLFTVINSFARFQHCQGEKGGPYSSDVVTDCFQNRPNAFSCYTMYDPSVPRTFVMDCTCSLDRGLDCMPPP